MRNQGVVWVYGSEARGDSQTDSDLDILVVGTIPESDVRDMFKSEIKPLSISRYSWDELEAMASYGSLFLHHLRLEGRAVFESKESEGKLARMLESLPRYRKADRDLIAFRHTVADVRSSMEKEGSIAFELSVLATMLRHSSILACYLLGTPMFGREEPVLAAALEFGLKEDLTHSFGQLYQWRLKADGRGNGGALGTQSVNKWCDIIELFLSHLEVLINESRSLLGEYQGGPRSH